MADDCNSAALLSNDESMQRNQYLWGDIRRNLTSFLLLIS